MKHFKRFIKDENGSELLQWAIIIIICVALAVIAKSIADSVSQQLNSAKQDIDNLNSTSSSVPSPTPTPTPTQPVTPP